MKRPWQIWLSFALCLGVVLAAMGGVTRMALRAESDRQRQSALEENIRLALWRMDSALGPLVAQESARPPAAYHAIYAGIATEPGRKSFTRRRIPSPLLTDTPEYVLLHFQFDALGQLTSPQVPSEDPRDSVSGSAAARLDELRDVVKPTMLLAMLPAPAPALATSSPAPIVSRNRPPPPGPPTFASPASAPSQQGVTPNASQQAEVQQSDQQPRQAAGLDLAQRRRGEQEYGLRSQVVHMNTQSFIDNYAFLAPATDDMLAGAGLMTPLWIDGRLLLARRVRSDEQEIIQGCQLDWTAIEAWLLESVADLFPRAALEAVSPPEIADQSRLLAALPVRLVAGPMATLPTDAVSTLRVPLVVAWTAVLLAAAAVAALLWGVIRLSERRGAFVSAVTHELRTPLTTFRMYAEMLAEDMVPSALERRRYLETLRTEADRLSHLVENVLSYARLERTDPRARISDVPVAQLLDRARQRLTDRAAGAGLTLSVETSNDAAQLQARTDGSAVEQILFNLVDNACKYAADSDPPSLHLEIDCTASSVVIRVRDHGRGISPAERRRLFRPFSKSAHQAARTAPGVGLGLALSRRLARDTGGDLTLQSSQGTGACFILTLPRAE